MNVTLHAEKINNGYFFKCIFVDTDLDSPNKSKPHSSTIKCNAALVLLIIGL